jgi:hypothetical protein
MEDKPGKPDPVRTWRAVEKMIEEDEIERIAAMSPDEVERELKAIGYDPARAPSVEELLARATRTASERQAAAAAVPQKAPTSIIRMKTRARHGRPVWLFAAAVACLVAFGIVAAERQQVVAWLRPPPAPIAPDDTRPPPVPPAEQAAKLRDEALIDFIVGQHADSEQKLDRARALDPAGESEPRVQQLRNDLAHGPPPPPPPSPPEKGSKPPL